MSPMSMSARHVQCAEKGELDLDANISTWLPVEIASPHFPQAHITIRHLLTHTAGLRDDESALEEGSRFRAVGDTSPMDLCQQV